MSVGTASEIGMDAAVAVQSELIGIFALKEEQKWELGMRKRRKNENERKSNF